MTERDFDKIFQDKIGDELPFDFRLDDWLAAEQELDKLLPAPAVVALAPRFLTWHKWAAAAAVLLLGSQLFLMTELRHVKQEMGSLRQESMALTTPNKIEKSASNTVQSIVNQHDTIIKMVYVEVPQKENILADALKARGINKVDFDSFVANQNALNDKNEAGLSNNKNDKTRSSEINLTTKNNVAVSLNTDKTVLQTVDNASRATAQKDSFLNKQQPLIANDLKSNEQVTPLEINTNKSVLNILPNPQLVAVKSINRAKNWLNGDAFDFMPMAKRPIITPIAEPNGWEISANSLFVNSDEHRRPQQRDNRNEDRLSVGANLRLGYNLRRNLRLSVEADFWSERHGKSDTARLSSPVPNPPFGGYTFSKVEQNTRLYQIRIGADYKMRQLFGLQPFVGVGLVLQKHLNDEFDFKFKKGDIEKRISVPNENRFNSPVSLSLRAGVEGKIYRRLSWSVDVNAQRGNTLSSHVGLKYAL